MKRLPSHHRFFAPRLIFPAAIVGAACLLSLGAPMFAQDKTKGKGTGDATKSGSDELVIVLVDGQKVTQLEVDRLFNARFQQRMDKLPAKRVEEIRQQMRPVIVDELLSKRLFIKEAIARKLEAKPEAVEKTYKQFLSGFKSEEEFQKYMKLINRTPEKVRREIAEEQMIQLVIQDELKTLKLPEPEELEVELKKLYAAHEERFVVPEKVKVRHILVSTLPDEDRAEILAEKEAKAKALRKKLVEDKDADFGKFAGKHSECPSRKQGGSLGEVERGKMVKEFEDAAFSQKVGEIGPVIKTEFGYHIIQVQSHSAKEKISYEEAKGGMAAEYLRNQQKEATSKFINALKAKAKIQWLDTSAKTSRG